MKVCDSYIPSSTGSDRIRVRWWYPEGEAKAVLQIAHGVAEHVERYDDFAEFLCSNGFLVVANDHLGHGKSIGSAKGWFAQKDGWFHVVKDLKSVFDASHIDGAPYFILGHSMGSFLLRTFLIMYPDLPLSGGIISGTGAQSGLTLAAGTAVCSIIGGIKGFDKVSPFVNKLAFGGYNKRIDPVRTDYDWLSRDDSQVDKYVADDLCGYDVTTGLARDMMMGIKFIQPPANLQKMNKALPVLFMSGEMDPVGGYGKGVRQAIGLFKSAGMESVDIKLYKDGRHEMLNETNRAEVFADILLWLNQHMAS